MRPRARILQNVGFTEYDVCIIGGGATGAGCALDAQLRGLKTILLEGNDFGSATSSASTKLIHGGIRYLQEAVSELAPGHYKLVKQALRERRIMMRNAPNLVNTRQFAIPCFSLLEICYYLLGAKLYDWLSGDSSLSPTRFMKRAASLQTMPWLNQDQLKGSVLYSDGQFDDARYNLALVHSCSAAGGDVLNYARVTGFDFSSSGTLTTAVVQDGVSQEQLRVKAKAFVNATGPFSDSIRKLADPDAPERLQLSRGVHILLPLPEHFGEAALLIPKTEDGRVIFAIPWQGRLLVGTTESEARLTDERKITRSEAEYLLSYLNRYLRKSFQLSDIVSAMVGLRPLIISGNLRDTKKIARDFEVEIGRSGLVSVLGGKWTIFRAMAEDAIDRVQRLISGHTTPSLTRTHRLNGSLPASDDEIAQTVRDLAAARGISRETADHLVHKFGANAGRVLDLALDDSTLLSPLVDGCPPIQGEVVYAIREEMAISIEDILSRRLGLQYFDWQSAMQAAPAAARILAQELGWTSERTRQETESYTERIRQFLRAIVVDDVHTQKVS